MKELGPWNAPELDSGMFCAIGENPGVDACPVIRNAKLHILFNHISWRFWCYFHGLQGDSGSGLVCIHNGHLTIVGVTSYGLDCGIVGMPGVYTKIAYSKHIKFIQSVVSADKL